MKLRNGAIISPKKLKLRANPRVMTKKDILPFLKLPGEVRNMIYGFVLGPLSPELRNIKPRVENRQDIIERTKQHYWNYGSDQYITNCAVLMQICKQIEQETKGYAINAYKTVQIDLGDLFESIPKYSSKRYNPRQTKLSSIAGNFFTAGMGVHLRFFTIDVESLDMQLWIQGFSALRWRKLHRTYRSPLEDLTIDGLTLVYPWKATERELYHDMQHWLLTTLRITQLNVCTILHAGGSMVDHYSMLDSARTIENAWCSRTSCPVRKCAIEISLEDDGTEITHLVFYGRNAAAEEIERTRKILGYRPLPASSSTQTNP